MIGKVVIKPVWLNRRDAAGYLGLTVPEFVELCRNKRGPAAIRVKGKARWDQIELSKWRESGALKAGRAWLAQ